MDNLVTEQKMSTTTTANDGAINAPDQTSHATANHETGQNGGNKTQATDDKNSTLASCKACGAEFGRFCNAWIRITGSYYLPAKPIQLRGLHAKTSKPRPAAEQSQLSGCTIQPLVCDRCDDTVAIICIKAPEDKQAYAEREFFKLPKIQLRSESSGAIVEPIVEGEDPVQPQKPAMEPSSESATKTISKQTLPSMSVLGHKAPEVPSREDSNVGRAAAWQAPPQLLPNRNSPVLPRDRSVASPYTTPVPTPTNGHLPNAGPVTYPSSIEVRLQAIDRLQTQVNLNRAMLESCTRDISKLEGSFVRLNKDVGETIEAIRRELSVNRQHASAAATHAAAVATSAPLPKDTLDDQALEVFSTTLSQVATKVNEVDALKVQFEVIKRKLRRLEEGSGPAIQIPGQQVHRRDLSMHHASPLAHTLPQVPSLPSQPAHPAHPPQTVQQPHQAQQVHAHHQPQAIQPAHPLQPAQPGHALHRHQPSHHQACTPETAQPTQQDGGAAAAAAAGWVSVNTAQKRPADGRPESAGNAIGSPKRAKLTPLEPRYGYPAQGTPGAPHAAGPAPEGVHAQAYRSHSHDNYPEATNPSTFVTYQHGGVSNPNWQHGSQRVVSDPHITGHNPGPSPRGRPRGRGRGGRPRKSMPLEPHLGQAEWENETWINTQSPGEGVYRGEIAQRGSGGGHGMAISPTQSIDPYSHTKRSRTKPIRNADGVLIRKDGRPDMRSQSSAANLRRVHAKKEEEMQGGVGDATVPSATDDVHGMVGSPMDSELSPAPSSLEAEMLEHPASNTQERSEQIMKQMFPRGVEEEETRLASAHGHFASEESPAVTAPTTPMPRSVSASVAPEAPRDDTPHQHQDKMNVDADADAGPVDGTAGEQVDGKAEKAEDVASTSPQTTAAIEETERPAAVDDAAA